LFWESFLQEAWYLVPSQSAVMMNNEPLEIMVR
jgi:hypothetical protein